MDDRSDNRTSPAASRPALTERLAAALRANLKRRKAQARGRADSVKAEKPGEKRQIQPNPSDNDD